MRILNSKIINFAIYIFVLHGDIHSQVNERSKNQDLGPVSTLNIDSFYADRITNLKDTHYLYSEILAEKTGISKDTLSKKVIFIHTWFAACAPCIAEFGEINELYRRFGTNKDFIFISFTFDDEKTIAEIKKKYNIKYKIYSIDPTLCRKINFSSGYPANILLYNNFLISKLYTLPVRNTSEFIRTEITEDIIQLLETRAK